MRNEKKLSIEKDFKLTPWNYEDFQEAKNKQKDKIIPKTTSYFLKRRSPFRTEKSSSYLQICKQRKEQRSMQRQEKEKPLLVRTINVTFDQQIAMKTIATERIKKDLQSFATQLTSRSKSKYLTNLKIKHMSKCKTTKQLRPHFLSFSQRNSKVTQTLRLAQKKQMIFRSHNNFFQPAKERTKSKSKQENKKVQKLLSSFHRNVIKDSNLRLLIKNTRNSLFKNQK